VFGFNDRCFHLLIDETDSVIAMQRHDHEDYVFFATGRLHRGNFDGFVAVQGIVSNDPKRCSTFVHHGIGFLGHFKDGRPFGICWRELLGGGWLYGEVNEEGHFTGKPDIF